MKALLGLGAVLCGLAVSAQTTPNQSSSWRASLSSLPATPSPGTSAQDIAEFEKNMRAAAPYLGSATPAIRALVQRMATYLSGLQTMASDPKLRSSVTHAQKSFDSLGFARFLAIQAAYSNAESEPSTVRVLPPFALNAPELTGVSDENKNVANELRTRYETDAAHSAGVWQNAETLRQSLELRGMGLNLETATSMIRLPQRFRSAATALRNNDWDEAREHLEQAEAETEKIAKTVGR